MCALLSTNALAQSNAKWSRNGDALSNGDWLGSTNNIPLLLKANNTLGLKINTNGDVVVNTLNLNNTTTNGLVLTNGQGKLFRTDFNGDASQYLAGDGTWQTMVSQQWKENGNDLYKPTGNVGIGIVPSPFYKLDVQGDARISNNLYVGGGIIITDKVNAATEIKGQNIKVDNDLEVQNSALFNGTSTFVGETNFYQLSTFNNKLKALQGIEFSTASSVGIRYTTNTNGGTFSYGRQIGAPININCSAAPSAGYNHQFGGSLQLFETDNNGNYVVGSGLLNMQTFSNSQSSIDASVGLGGAVATGGGLLINYFCGSNTGINTGTLGGTVSMGKNVEIGFPNANANCALNVNGAPNYMGLYLTTNHTGTYGYNTRLEVNKETITAFAVNNNMPTIARDVFTILGNGTTMIGKGQALSPNKMLTVNGDVLFANNGTTSSAHQYDGFSGFEIVGGDRVPTRRGISVEDDPNGDMSFFINSAQCPPNGTCAQFRFKNGVQNLLGNIQASTAPDLLVIRQSGATIINSYETPSSPAFTINNANTNTSSFIVNTSGDVVASELTIKDRTSNITKFKIDNTGKLQIGDAQKNTSVHNDALLSVAGKIAAKSCYIRAASWADYVFEPNYKLPNLYDVETYYKANKHLPEIPSECEVLEQGIDVAEMNKLLLKKIEEMTILMVQMRKEIDALKTK